MGVRSAVIFDIDAPPALAAVRSLGRARVHTRVYGQRLSLTGVSRFAGVVHTAPPVTHGDQFLAWLRRQLADGLALPILPTSDIVAYMLTCVDSELTPKQRSALAPAQRVRECVLKD